MDTRINVVHRAARGGGRRAPMRGNVIETVMGAVVIIVAALFLFFAYTTSRIGAVSGYPLTAQFSSVSGLHVGSDVNLAGVKIGTVTGETLDPKTYLATIQMSIARRYKLPEDTVAKITSSGLLGNEYVQLIPGGSEKTLPPGGRIKYTQAAVNIEDLIGQMMYSPSGGAHKSGGGAALPGLPGLPPMPNGAKSK